MLTGRAALPMLIVGASIVFISSVAGLKAGASVSVPASSHPA